MRAFAVKRVLFTALMGIIALLFVFPFYCMLMMSTHYTESIYKGAPLLPGGYLIQNLKTVFQAHFEIYYRNSLVTASLCTLLSVLVSTLSGYSLAKFEFKGRRLCFSFILITMMIPTQLGLVAFVVEMKQIGWINTLLPLIVPPAATGFGVYWMKNYITGALPTEILESGRMDGAGEPRILFHIAVPCLKPALLSLGLINFVSSWNAYLVPLIVLNKPNQYTVPIGIINLNAAYRNDLAAKITALSLGTVPLLVLFALTSRSFISGITMGAVKG